VAALARCRGLRLKIAGAGPQEQDLREQVARAGLDGRVDFLGFVSDEDLLDLYARCRAAVYAPLNEDYGYVTVEPGRRKQEAEPVRSYALASSTITSSPSVAAARRPGWRTRKSAASQGPSTSRCSRPRSPSSASDYHPTAALLVTAWSRNTSTYRAPACGQQPRIRQDSAR
jgi:hypothetical protein